APQSITSRGKGVWVVRFSSIGLSPQQLADRAQQLGIGFVLVKAGEDDWSYPDNLNASVVDTFAARGIDVYAWVYVRPGNTWEYGNTHYFGDKIANIASLARIRGIKGMILDVEWEWFGQGGDATALCRGIRDQAPGVFLGYTPNLNWTNHGYTRLKEPSMFL